MSIKLLSLSKNQDFKSLLAGKKISNKYLTIFFKNLSNKSNKYLNISFVTQKKIGNAVKRNKAKRIMRELAKKVIEYFYNNPEANTSKEMEEVFNVSHRRIRNIMTKHLKEKLENSFARRMASY